MAKASGRSGASGWLRAVDDGVFAVEQTIVALALIGITVLMFVNVVARRIQAPDSKVGALLAKLAGLADAEGRAWIDENVAPWVSLGTAFALIVFGYFTWRRFVHRRNELGAPDAGRTLLVGSAVAAVVIAVAWGFARVFLVLESKVVFAGMFGGAALAYAIHALWRKPAAFGVKTAIALAGGAAVVWFCLVWFPVGYTWTNKVSLMLLLWVGMLGASVCVHEGKHIRIEALGKLAPEAARRYVSALGFVVAAGFAAIMTYLGFLYMFGPMASDDPELSELWTLFGTRYVIAPTSAFGLEGRIEGTDIPDWVGTLSVLVGFGLATVRFLGGAVSSVLGGHYGAPAAEESLEEARSRAVHGEPVSESSGEAEPEPGTGSSEDASDDGGAETEKSAADEETP